MQITPSAVASHFSFCSCTILWFSHCRSWLICRAHPPSPGSGCVTSLCDRFLALPHQIQTFSFISMILHYLSPLFIIFHQLLGCQLLPMTGDGCSAMCFLSYSLLNLGRSFFCKHLWPQLFSAPDPRCSLLCSPKTLVSASITCFPLGITNFLFGL